MKRMETTISTGNIICTEICKAQFKWLEMLPRYSPKTIQRIVADLVENPGKIAFLSTPSLYFSIPEDLRSESFVFDVRSVVAVYHSSNIYIALKS